MLSYSSMDVTPVGLYFFRSAVLFLVLFFLLDSPLSFNGSVSMYILKFAAWFRLAGL